ncbi:AAA family ATPase [Pengzhenrongella sp.]|uniref:AAA family ATPase n=1 Tax=Pengzhenrongella sp. TaxID=2888820 RepID=UPI002F95D668
MRHLARDRDRGLDSEQVAAAATVASGDALVVVEGAAGAGKTTMLGVAIEAARAEGRATRIVTPTKKAADVAARELGVPTDSVAKLAHDHGWRWNQDGVWTRLAVGAVDPDTGTTYTGPPAAARLRHGEQVVVDEAGMLDQETALALLQIADEAGACVALVGDRAQLPAVGRGGVLDIAAQVSQRTFDMATVHRFTDPEYADLTVRMRRGENPVLLFERLHALGLVLLHPTIEDVHSAIARSARDGDAVTAATNDEARTLNTSIRDMRVRRGEVDDVHVTYGSDGLPIGAGDLIATRDNDSRLGVANRQTWTVRHVTKEGDVWARAAGTGREHWRRVQLPAGYVAEHTHLAYAATAYGVQSATMPASHTVLSDALDGAGVYVGMTRGRDRNTLQVVATDLDDARDQFITALRRDRADRGLTVATRVAREAVDGLVPAGPVAFVNAERARLREWIQTADQEAARCERARGALTQQRAAHHTEYEQQAQIVAAADTHVMRVRAELAAPLIEQATVDGTGYLTAQERTWQANRSPRATGRFGKRAAARTAREATEAHGTAQDAMNRRWGDVPLTMTHLPFWAEAVAGQQVDTAPRMIEARQDAERAHREQQQLTADHAAARSALWQDIDRGHRPSSLEARSTDLRGRAHQARRTLAEIEALPIAEAAQLIRDRTAQAAAERTAKATSRARAAELSTWPSPPPEYPSIAEPGFGPGL